jgi:hypothetical protein
MGRGGHVAAEFRGVPRWCLPGMYRGRERAVCARRRPNVKDEIKNALFPKPPPGAHPNFRRGPPGSPHAAWPCPRRAPPARLNARRGARRLLCAGVWMGRVGAVRHYLSQFFLAAGHIDGRAWDDQGCALPHTHHGPQPALHCPAGARHRVKV